jgi:plasmid stabilization system protein ParE
MPHVVKRPRAEHVVFYYPLHDGVEIVRVLSGARDVEEEMFE